MRSWISHGVILVMLSVASGCAERSQPAMAATSQAILIEQRVSGGETVQLERTDEPTLQAVRAWLDRVLPRQPAQEELGSVMPWRTIRLYRTDGSGRALEREVHIFTYADSTQSELLVTEEEQVEFDRIISGGH